MFKNILIIIFALLTVSLSASSVETSKNKPTKIHEVDITDYPYIVAVFLEGERVCSGSILNKDFILTAGSCTYGSNADPKDISVRVGSTYSDSNGTVIGVTRYYLHPDYSVAGINLQILRLSESIEFGPTAQPVKLPDRNVRTLDGVEMDLVGWGYWSGSNHLRVNEVKTTGYLICELHVWGFINTIYLCVTADWIEDCNGDYGSPLVKDDVLWGVAANGQVCSPNPAAFNNVSFPVIRDFITQITGL